MVVLVGGRGGGNHAGMLYYNITRVHAVALRTRARAAQDWLSQPVPHSKKAAAHATASLSFGSAQDANPESRDSGLGFAAPE
jgi:hypothetical protein